MNRRPKGVLTSKEVWRLRNSRSTLVECRIERTVSKLHALTIVSGSETLLEEGYPDSTSAMVRAHQVRDRLLGSGQWTDVNAQPESRRTATVELA